MVDFTHLQERPVDNTISQLGFVCENCRTWEAVLYMDASLREALRKLTQYPPGHRKFPYLWTKALRKVESVRRRGEAHGSFQRQDMASA